MEHVGVAVANLTASIQAYENVFGYRVLSGPFDDPIQRVRVCFLGNGSAGELAIELIEPLGSDSPVTRLLAKGGGAYHVCYNVANLDQALEEIRAKGCLVVAAPAPAVAYGGRRIAWFFTPDRQLVELVERAPSIE